MNCSEIRPHLEALALGALDPLTRSQVESHLGVCAECRATLASLRGVVDELPFALGQHSPLHPPPSLKANLLRAAQQEVEAHAQTTAIRETFAPRASAPIANRGRWLLNPRLWMFSLGTSMVVIVALVGWLLVSNLQMQQALSKAQVAQKKFDDIQNQQAMAVSVLNSLTAQEMILTPPDASSPALGRVVIDSNKPTVVFIGYHLPALAPGESYALWTIDKGMMQQRGLFTPNRDGFAMVVFLADRSDPLLKEVLVTRQALSNIYPSTERVLVWKSDPNDLSEEISVNSIFARPTVIRPGH